MKEKLAEAVEFPKEIVLSMPKITVLGRKEATIENHQGIIAMEEDNIRLYTAMGVLCLWGEDLDIAAISDEDIHITGFIRKIEFQ